MSAHDWTLLAHNHVGSRSETVGTQTGRNKITPCT